MTQKELHSQRLLREAERAVIRMQTRRHFIKESAMGLGALALGSMFGRCTNSPVQQSGVTFGPAHPRYPKFTQFAANATRVIYLHVAGPPSKFQLFDL